MSRDIIRDISSSYDHIYIACGHTDMRKQIDGLVALVKSNYELDPYSNSLFLFCGRKRDRLKALSFDGTGFVLLYKRLEENGIRFQWPRNENEVHELTRKQTEWLLDGLSPEQPKAFKQSKRRNLI